MRKGSKYVKLKGFEVATPENKKRADAFMRWFGYNSEWLSRVLNLKDQPYNYDIAVDTALKIYDDIALKGRELHSNKKYFFRAYRTNYLAAKIKNDKDVRAFTSIENQHLAANNFDPHENERAIDNLKCEILEYVRANFDEVSVALFEIYVGLQPETSYDKMSALLGVPHHTINTSLGNIRKSVQTRFGSDFNNLLSRF